MDYTKLIQTLTNIAKLCTPVSQETKKTSVVYQAAVAALGKHMTLDESIPKEVGCAQAVSAVLKDAGVIVPTDGISATIELLRWLQKTPGFEEISRYETGAIIISATGTGNGSVRGHTGICGTDSIIMSNESESGIWKGHWDLASWNKRYRDFGGIPTRFFRYKL